MKGLLIAAALAAGTTLATPAPALHAQPVTRLPAADRPLAGRPATLHTLDGGGTMQAASVAFDAADNLYVLDRAGARVVVFDRAGRQVRAWGRRGMGPGDLLAPVRLAVTREGQVVVSDVGRRAFTVFRPDGQLVASIPFSGGRMAGVMELRAHPRGGVVADARPFAMGGRLDGGAAESRVTLVWRPLDPRAAESTLFTADEVVVRGGQSGAPRSQVVAAGPPAFAPRLSWAPLPGGGLAIASTERYSVRVTGPGGRAERTLERPFSPRAVTERDRQLERERMRRALASGEGAAVIPVGNRPVRIPAEIVEAQVSGMEFADRVPVVEALAAAPSGTIWVKRSGAAPGQPGPIDLLAPAGRYLGTLSGLALPDAFSASGRAAWIETDARGRSVVRVATLPAAWR